jgi:hypothetical protein
MDLFDERVLALPKEQKPFYAILGTIHPRHRTPKPTSHIWLQIEGDLHPLRAHTKITQHKNAAKSHHTQTPNLGTHMRARLCLCRRGLEAILSRLLRAVFLNVSFAGMPQFYSFQTSNRSFYRGFLLLFLRGLCSVKVWPLTSIRADSVC